MDLLSCYSDSESTLPPSSSVPAPKSSAPDVDVRAEVVSRLDLSGSNSKIVLHNPEADLMWAPFAGPQHPLKKSFAKNTLLGYVEKHNMADFNFNEQYHTFQSFGYAADPSSMQEMTQGTKMIGNLDAAQEKQGKTVTDIVSKQEKREAYAGLRKRKDMGNGADPSTYLGPWAPYEVEEIERMLIEKGMKVRDEAKREDDEVKKQEKEKKEAELEVDEVTGKKKPKGTPSTAERTIFSGDSVYDYQGRTYMHPPGNLHPIDHDCFAPKKEIHTFTGHNKGVNAIRWFPKFGHLLLSCSMDGTVKLWDACNSRKCLRSFLGHTGSVRDIHFSNDGKTFLSTSFDKYIKLWDTETGQCITRFSNDHIGYCVRFHPENNNELLTGMKNKQVLQWDVRDSKKPTQIYDEHLGPVNAVLFVDDNRRFVSSSDDKKVLFWEYGLPVVVKHIAEPHLQSVPSLALHPDGDWFLAQSMDNMILCYGARDKGSMYTRKRFTGHFNAGFACQAGFSADGQFVVSGDGNGQLFVWDWKTTKVYKKLSGHNQATMGCEWHPVIPSQVATCSWDGTIKLWE